MEEKADILLPLGPEFLYGYRRTKMVEAHDAHCLEHHWNKKEEPIFNPDLQDTAPPADDLLDAYVRSTFPYVRASKNGLISEYYETMYSYAYERTLEHTTSAGLGLHGTVPYANLGLEGSLDGSFKYKRSVTSNRWKFFAYYMHPVVAVDLDETRLGPEDFNEAFKKDLRNILKYLNDNPAVDEEIRAEELNLWVAFLKRWGTHYLRQIQVGGKIVCSANLETNSRNQHLGGDIEGTLKATLEQALGGNIHGKYSFSYDNKTRDAFSTITFEDQGGYASFNLPTKVLGKEDLSEHWNTNTKELGEWKKRIVEGKDVRPIFHIFYPVENLFKYALESKEEATLLEDSRKKLYPTLVRIFRVHHHRFSSRQSAMALVQSANRWWTQEVGSVTDVSADDRGIFLEYKVPPKNEGEHRRSYYNIASQRFISAESVEYLHASLTRELEQSQFNKIELKGAQWAPHTFALESVYPPLAQQSRSLHASKRHHKEVKLCRRPALPAIPGNTDGHVTDHHHHFEWRIEKP